MSNQTRRRFLQAAAAGAVALPAVASAAEPRREPDKQDGFGGFTVAIQSYSFRKFTFERALEQMQKLGVRNAELYREHVPVTATDAQIRAARTTLERYQVTPVAFGVERFTKDHAANRRLFEFARKLGVRFLTADPDPDSFDSLDSLVVEFGIGIAIHPHGPVGKQLHRWYSAEEIMKAVRERTLIGACLDTGHLIRSAQDPFNRKLDPAQQVRHMGHRNFGMHLKDHDNKRRTDVVFGRGVLNVGNVLRALREVRFGGYIAIEYEANPENPADDIRACLDVFRDAVRKLA
jgi:sugar phosphate isomerase/epimerase